MDTTAATSTERDVGGQLVGAIISAGFGSLWSVGCAAALASVSLAAAVAVAAVGVLLGITLIVGAIRTRAARNRAGVPGRPNAMFASRGYRIVVALEVLAIVVAGPVFGRLGLGDFVVLWVAFVVGVHFLGFGRLFWRGYYLIGAVMVLGAAAALVLALTVSTTAAAVLVSTVCAADLLVAAGVALRDARVRR